MSHIITGHTCGEACWTAREDVCRCSCGGKNHGCLKSSDGIQPDRSAKFYGKRFVLRALDEVEEQAQAINQAAGISFLYAHSAREHYGYEVAAVVRMATPAQVNRWPELCAYRDSYRPYLLWVREDIAA